MTELAGGRVVQGDWCAAHNRPILDGEWDGLWCGFYVPELGVGEDYGCWISEGTDDGY